MSDRPALAVRLRELRESLRRSQKEMALSVGGSQRAWADYEGGRTAPGAVVLTALAEQGVDIHWLLTGEGTMKRPAQAGLDEGLLADVITGVQEELRQRGISLPAGKYALLIKEVYMETLERLSAGQMTAAACHDLIARFVRLAG